MTTFREAAVQALQNMNTVWKKGDAFRNCTGGGCFWMAGNFIQTAMQGLYALKMVDTYGFGQQALDFFDSNVKDLEHPRDWPTEYKIWVDDYGWWGIALVHAYIFADTLGYDAATKQKFAVRAQACWEAMNEFWQTSSVSWDVGVDPNKKHYSVSGGVPNTLDDFTLAGRNCVTNEVYWALTNLLIAEFGDAYRDKDKLASDFFKQALDQKILYNDTNLVYERFFGMPGSTHSDWTWLGDQGLFAYSCSRNGLSNLDSFGNTQAKMVINAVISKMITKNGVLHEDPAPWSAYIMDYACGKGTFMRYLGIVNSSLQSGGVTAYNDFILLNARAIWKNRNVNTGLFGFYWDGEAAPPSNWGYGQATADAILHGAGFAAIVAALSNFSDQPIDQAAVTAGAV